MTNNQLRRWNNAVRLFKQIKDAPCVGYSIWYDGSIINSDDIEIDDTLNEITVRYSPTSGVCWDLILHEKISVTTASIKENFKLCKFKEIV
jgi:hypothetical protein